MTGEEESRSSRGDGEKLIGEGEVADRTWRG